MLMPMTNCSTLILTSMALVRPWFRNSQVSMEVR
jgi:hypothetical protein